MRLSALAAEHAAYVKRERRFTKALGAFLKTQFDRRLTALVVRRRGAARGAPAPSAVLFPSEFADDTDSRALEQVETAMAGAAVVGGALRVGLGRNVWGMLHLRWLPT